MSNGIGNETLIVEIDGIDVSDDVISAPISLVVKPDWGEIPTSPDLTLTLQNLNNQYSPHNLTSLFPGNKLSDVPLKVFRGGIIRWDGFIDDINIDLTRKYAIIKGETLLQNALNKSSKTFFGANTPSQLAINVLQQHNIQIDTESFQIAEDILNDIPVQAEISPDVFDWQGTLGDILQMIAVAGIARFFYTTDGKIGMDTFNLLDNRPSVFTLTDNDLEQQPSVTTEIRDSLRGYKVQYKYDTVEELITGVPFNNPLQTIDMGANQAVTLIDLGSAVYLGERWIEVSETPYYRIVLNLDHEIASNLTLNQQFIINSDTLGFTKKAEIIGIDLSNPKYGILTVRVRI